MAALPYMPLYVADYMADASHLTTFQHGAYMLLLMNYWQRGGPLPDDDVKLSRIARMNMREWKRNRAVLAEFFVTDGTLWVSRRVDSELARVASKSLKSKAAAQASVQRRFGERSAPVERVLNHTDTSKEKKERETKVSPKKAAHAWRDGDAAPDDWLAWAVAELGWTRSMAAAEATKFLDNALAHRRVYMDWKAAWRQWCRSPFQKTVAPRQERLTV